MKTYLKPLFLLSGSALAAISTLNAGAPAVVATDPVGYVTTTTPDGDDALIGLPLAQASVLASVADSVSGAEVTVTPTLVVDAYNNTHYVLATSGSNAGQWSEVVDTSATSITTAEVLLAPTDTFDVIPFWTLATAFPAGAGVGVSPDGLNPIATVLLNNPLASGVDLSSGAAYLYFADGVNDGWYDSTSFAPSNGVVLVPDTYLTIRNNTGGDVTTVISGTVPTNVVGSTILRQLVGAQDTQLVNPYPAPLTLAGSGLASVISASTDGLNPTDTVLIYDIAATSGQDISTAAAYMYFTDGVNDGWYDTTSFAPSGAVEIPVGGAFLVRRAEGVSELVVWNPAVPYTL